MKTGTYVIGAALLVVAGCTVPATGPEGKPARVGKVSEAVVNLAAPNQDLSTARLLPEDGCYWYEHNGPVETTLVPLRAVGGNPICTKSAA
ncbi:hypothetical protein DSM110093_00347 [Sulfitobacter sp. DSM 110093]|uniref:hypothetical protein n=1 Tax=Sulfitobacter sp. DSM 110093 TaxID=2883127 RepID=UPI001FAB8EFE|nr:hypothetical protein [Sulfitobacter sp. DSM 110093]UOA30595.1 hypothetical protein DSM110093_00347 [Sulfitobacter sp. DSM 110093]